VQPLCEDILKSIRANASLAGLRLLPSAALAIGYFENFILPVRTSGRVTIGARTWNLAKDEFKFIVIIPDEFGPTFHANLGQILREAALEHLTVPTASRSFPFYVQAGTDEGALQL
jgi:hypothetical protein